MRLIIRNIDYVCIGRNIKATNIFQCDIGESRRRLSWVEVLNIINS